MTDGLTSTLTIPRVNIGDRDAAAVDVVSILLVMIVVDVLLLVAGRRQRRPLTPLIVADDGIVGYSGRVHLEWTIFICSMFPI
jgi:hypothetical protein